MISAAANEIIDQMTPAELDQVADRILAKASDAMLDKALERRLKTIEAKRLINALARAERLGYEPGDVDDSADAPLGQQQMPLGHPPQQPAPTPAAPPSEYAPSAGVSAAAAVAAAPAAAPAAAALPLHCTICFRRFSTQTAHAYHVKGKVCTRVPSSPGGFKYNCQHCGQGFTTVMGLQYVRTTL